MEKLKKRLEVQIDKRLKNTKIVMHDGNVADLVYFLTEIQERKAGRVIISDQDLETVVKEITTRLLKNNMIYKQSNWTSYANLVRSRDRISQDELSHMKLLIQTTKKVDIRDTEFPLDQNARYCEPLFESQDGYHTIISGKGDDSTFIQMVRAFKQK